ncbi:YaiI/YqxD family protein [[Clostridium] colinum]|uniref:YaiI/YqxD family protein n=1 Tax=[Clostridium] colinum TaxID=36835 RepID=UPI002025A001|nr:YaiI/YqxD family protein [[Clostridium] colinum]
MKILIDADGCPVINICIDIALKNNIEVLIVYDTSHIFNFENEKITCIIADKGKDSSDFILLNKCEKNDIVVTQDYSLAAMCLTKNCFVINQNGYIFTNNNINELLLRKHIGKKLRKSGKKDFKIKKRTKECDYKFIENFTKLINNQC